MPKGRGRIKTEQGLGKQRAHYRCDPQGDHDKHALLYGSHLAPAPCLSFVSFHALIASGMAPQTVRESSGAMNTLGLGFQFLD
jgi:hypothetical protein